MRKFGFKLYSDSLKNAPDLIKECAEFSSSVSDAFIELMVMPDSTMDDLRIIKKQISQYNFVINKKLFNL